MTASQFFSSPLGILLGIIILVLIIGLWVNSRLIRVQARLRSLGNEYFKREKVVFEQYKAGLLTESDYRKEHERLLSEMKEQSRHYTD